LRIAFGGTEVDEEGENLHLGSTERAQQRVDLNTRRISFAQLSRARRVNSSSSCQLGVWVVSSTCAALRRLPRAALA